MRLMTVKRKTGEETDSRGRKHPTYTTFTNHLKVFSIGPVESSEAQAMNIDLTTTAFNLILRGEADVTTDDLIPYLGVEFDVISVKRFTGGPFSLKSTQVVITYSGDAL